ncbi:MAG: acyltransferase [Actinobacteria bacterium]|nr:acyltransferase [Actinomycetota bacterium]
MSDPALPVEGLSGRSGGRAGAPLRGLRAGLRFVLRNRMYGPRYWVLGLRYLWRFKVRNRHIVTRGIVFVARSAEVSCRRGLGHLEIGRWVWIGERDRVRCHEGYMSIGDKAVFGAGVTVNGYLDVEIGEGCMVADGAYVADFDHRHEDLTVPIRKQGIVKSPVRIEPDCWIGVRAVVLRGSTVGRGSVIGAHAVVKGHVPPGSVAAGVPARVIRRRGDPG